MVSFKTVFGSLTSYPLTFHWTAADARWPSLKAAKSEELERRSRSTRKLFAPSLRCRKTKKTTRWEKLKQSTWPIRSGAAQGVDRYTAALRDLDLNPTEGLNSGVAQMRLHGIFWLGVRISYSVSALAARGKGWQQAWAEPDLWYRKIDYAEIFSKIIIWQNLVSGS